MSYSSTVIADAPLIYYRLDDASGTVATDSSGNGNNGVYNGAITLGAAGATSDNDAAISLPGTSTAYVSSPSLTYGTSFTLEGWFNPANYLAASQSYEMLLADSSSTFSFLAYCPPVNGGTQSSHFAVEFGGTTAFLSANTYAAGVWHHVVYTWDGTNQKIYVNGELDTTGTATATTNSPTWTGSTYVGVCVPDASYPDPLQGSADEVAVYNVALTATQVKNHYLAGIGEAQVTATYDFDANQDSWTVNGTAATGETLAWSTTDSTLNPSVSGSGSLEHSLSGKGVTSAASWLSPSQSLSALGVPAGATVTEISASVDWSCTAYSKSGASSFHADILLNGAVNTTGATNSWSATTSWATATTTATLTDTTLTDTIQVALTDTMATNASGGGTFTDTVNYDHVVITVTYKTAGGTNLAASILGNGAIQALPTNTLPLSATLSGAGVIASQLTVVEHLAGVLQGGSIAATVTQGHDLAGVLDGNTAITAIPSISRALSGVLAGGNVAGTLTRGVILSATILSDGGMTSLLARGDRLAASLTGSGEIIASPTQSHSLSGFLVGGYIAADLSNIGHTSLSAAIAGGDIAASLENGHFLSASLIAGGITASATRGILLSSFIGSPGAISGRLLRAVTLQASMAGANAVAASLTHGAHFTGAVQGLPSIAGIATRGSLLQATMFGGQSLSVKLSQDIALAAALTPPSGIAGILHTGKYLAGRIIGGSLSATLTRGDAFGGTVSGTPSLSISLTHSHSLSEIITASSQITAIASIDRGIAGIIPSTGGLAASVTRGLRLTAVLSEITGPKSSILVSHALSGAIAGSDALSASLAPVRRISAVVVGSPGLQAIASTTHALSASLIGGMITSSLSKGSSLQALISSSSAIAATMTRGLPLYASITGGYLAITPSVGHLLRGDVGGASDIVAGISLARAFATTVGGSPNVVAAPSTSHNIIAAITSGGDIAFTQAMTLSAAIAGGSIAAAITVAKSLVATVPTRASLAATAVTGILLSGTFLAGGIQGSLVVHHPLDGVIAGYPAIHSSLDRGDLFSGVFTGSPALSISLTHAHALTSVVSGSPLLNVGATTAHLLGGSLRGGKITGTLEVLGGSIALSAAMTPTGRATALLSIAAQLRAHIAGGSLVVLMTTGHVFSATVAGQPLISSILTQAYGGVSSVGSMSTSLTKVGALTTLWATVGSQDATLVNVGAAVSLQASVSADDTALAMVGAAAR